MKKKKTYIEIDFYKLWRYVRLERLQKEKIKSLLFIPFPFLFNRFAAYQHWKNAQIFSIKRKSYLKQHAHAGFNKKETGMTDIKFAIVFHVFYLDVFQKVLTLLPRTEEVNYKLFISCPTVLINNIEKKLNNHKINFEIIGVENRGRDILPFLKVLPLVFEQGYNLVLKLHTKRSNHLNKKDPWSSHLFDKLLKNGNLTKTLRVFSSHPEVGMMGPEGNILPMALYYGGNAAKVKVLCLQMGLKAEQLRGLNFVAGSMFYARKEVLLPILKLNLIDNDFDKENKQLDNTLAHAIERVFPAGLNLNKMILADTSSTPEKVSCNITLNHPFSI